MFQSPPTSNLWVVCLPSPNLVGRLLLAKNHIKSRESRHADLWSVTPKPNTEPISEFFSKIPRVFQQQRPLQFMRKAMEFCSSWNRPKTTETFQIPTESVIARRQVSVLLATSLSFKQRRKKHGKITQVLRPPTIRSSKIMGFFNAPLVLWLGDDALETNEKRPGMSTGLKNPSRICPLLVKHFAQCDQKVAELCFHLHSQASQASIYKQYIYIYHICTIYYILYTMHV